MKIEVGEYIRTKRGLIGKVNKIELNRKRRLRK